MSDLVLDASALLAVLQREPGTDRWADEVIGATISAVNLSEVVAKLLEFSMPMPHVQAVLDPLGLEVVPFDAAQAVGTALLRMPTRAFGLSLGDRACLALAKSRGARALTTERAWAAAKVGVTVMLIR